MNGNGWAVVFIGLGIMLGMIISYIISSPECKKEFRSVKKPSTEMTVE